MTVTAFGPGRDQPCGPVQLGPERGPTQPLRTSLADLQVTVSISCNPAQGFPIMIPAVTVNLASELAQVLGSAEGRRHSAGAI